MRDVIATVENVDLRYHMLDASISVPTTRRERPERVEVEHGVLSLATTGDRYAFRFPVDGSVDYEYGLPFRELKEDLAMTPAEEGARFTVLDRAVVSVGGHKVLSSIKMGVEKLDEAVDAGKIPENVVNKRIVEKMDEILSHTNRFFLEEEKVGIQYRRTQKMFPETRLFNARKLSRAVLEKYELLERAREEFKRIKGIIKEPNVLAPSPEAEIDNIYGYLGNPYAYSVFVKSLTLGWRFVATPVISPPIRVSIDGMRRLNVKLYAVHVGRGRRVVCALP